MTSIFHIGDEMQTKAYEYNKLEPENADQVAFSQSNLLWNLSHIVQMVYW